MTEDGNTIKQKYQMFKGGIRANKILISIGVAALFFGMILFLFNLVNKQPKPIMNENNDFSLQPEYPTVEETSRKDPLKCNNLKKIEGIGLTQPDDLRSLESYQELCDSFVSDHFMIFSSFPSSMLAAEEIAQKLSEKISEFQRLGVVPVILIEPADKFKYVPLKQIADGEYQEEINSMFQKLLQSGINLEKDMIWIPYPEINTPT